ncbi:MAG: sugar-binding transcriptional regulator [Eubacteriales bacterium]
MSVHNNLDDHQISKICHMFYKQELSKVEIADKMHISRFKVSRLLDKAKKEGIIKIEIITPSHTSEELFDLEEKLEEKLDLKAIMIVTGSRDNDDINARQLGEKTSSFLLETITSNEVLGISWGTTVSEVIKAIPKNTGISDIKIVQLTGGLGQLNTIDGMKMIHMTGEKFNTEVSMFMVPVFVNTKEMKNILLADPDIQETTQLFNTISIALVGIGSWFPDIKTNLHKAGRFSDADVELLLKKGVVGDVFNHLVDIHGNILDGTLEDRLMTIDIEKVMKIPYVIGVAGGISKAHAIIGSVRSGCIDALITDQYTAYKMLEILDTL